jgi:nucleoid DNA-binding protein
MTKAELIDAVAKGAADQGIELTKKDVRALLDVVFDTVSSAIKNDERFSYPNFGTFKLKHRKARKGRNPKTRETIQIPASNSVGFKPAPTLSDLIN